MPRTVLGPRERVNLNHWTTDVILTTAVQTPVTRRRQRVIAGTHAVKLLQLMHKCGTMTKL
jgi:hypothetical protein